MTAQISEDQSTARSRRALIGLGAIASVAVLAAPKSAKADLSMSEVRRAVSDALEPVKDLLGGINEILGTAFSLVVGLSIPTSFQELIRCMLGPIGAGFNFNACTALRGLFGGPFQILRTGSIEPHMEEIWPTDLMDTPRTANEQIRLVYEATKVQVASSQATTAGLAEAQVMLGEEDTAVLEALNGAAAAGSLISVAALHARLTFSTNQRLAMIIQALNAMQQTNGNQTMRAAHDKYLEVLSREMQREPTLFGNPGAQRLGG